MNGLEEALLAGKACGKHQLDNRSVGLNSRSSTGSSCHASANSSSGDSSDHRSERDSKKRSWPASTESLKTKNEKKGEKDREELTSKKIVSLPKAQLNLLYTNVLHEAYKQNWERLELGRLLRVIATIRFDMCPHRTAKYMRKCFPELVDVEVLEGLELPLSARQLLQIFADGSGNESVLIRKIGEALESGHLSLQSDDDDIESRLFKTLRVCDKNVEEVLELVAHLIASLSTIREVCLLMRACTAHFLPAQQMSVWNRIVIMEVFHDMTGDRGIVFEYFPHLKGLLEIPKDLHAEDADEHGNLAGFCVGDDEIEYDESKDALDSAMSSNSDEDEDEDDILEESEELDEDLSEEDSNAVDSGEEMGHHFILDEAEEVNDDENDEDDESEEIEDESKEESCKENRSSNRMSRINADVDEEQALQGLIDRYCGNKESKKSLLAKRRANEKCQHSSRVTKKKHLSTGSCGGRSISSSDSSEEEDKDKDEDEDEDEEFQSKKQNLLETAVIRKKPRPNVLVSDSE